MQSFKYYFLLSATILITSLSYSQNWRKHSQKKTNDSIYAIYDWNVHDNYHSAGGQIILKKNKRFLYSAYHPLSFQEHSEGTYLIKNRTLILSSDYQSDNLKVAIRYKDKRANDTLYNNLKHPLNKNGDTLYNTYYLLNNDTSIDSHYDPSFPLNIKPLTVIKSLKVMFYETNYGSPWIPITQSDKIIEVMILNNVNADDHNYKVIKNWKFKIYGNKLIPLSNIIVR